MQDKVIQQARELIRTYGLSLLDDTERLGQLLEGRSGDDRHEIFLLCFALRDISKGGSFPTSFELARDREHYVEAFCEDLGFSDYVANWAVDAIAQILADVEDSQQEGAHVEAKRGVVQSKTDSIPSRPRSAPMRKKAMRNGIILLVIALAFLGLFVKMTDTRHPSQGEHRLLFLAHLSGADASSGQVRLKAAQLAADMLNEQGGIKGRRIQIAVQDMPYDPSRADAAARAMLRDRSATAMISACGDDVNDALARIADEYETPIIFSESSRLGATMDSSKPLLYSFRVNYDNSYKGRLLAYFVTHGLKRRRVALLSLAHDVDSQETREAFAASFEGGVGEIVCDLSYTRRGGLDHASLNEFSSSGADCIVFTDPTPDFAEIVTSVRSAGFGNTMLATAYSDELGEAAGPLLDDTWWIVPTAPDDSALMSFQTSYRDKFGENVRRGDFVGTMLAYDAVRWMADALYRAPGFQGEALRHAFLSTRNLALSHATLSIDPRTHGPWSKSASLLYTSGGRTRFQRRFRPQ